MSVKQKIGIKVGGFDQKKKVKVITVARKIKIIIVARKKNESDRSSKLEIKSTKIINEN